MKGGISAYEVILKNKEQICLYNISNLSVTHSPSISINILGTKDPVVLGEYVPYIVKCRNESTSVCNNIILKYKFSELLELVKYEGTMKYKLVKNTIIFAPYPLLKPNETLYYKIIFKANKIGLSKNISIVGLDNFDDEYMDVEKTFIQE